MIEPDTRTLEEGQETFHDIEDFAASYQLAGKYRCSLHQWDENLSEWAFLKAYQDRMPPPDEVAKHYGCGLARWTVVREERDPVTRERQKNLEYKMLLKGDHFEEMHAAYKVEKDAERLKKLRERMETTRMENMYLGTPGQSGGFEESLKMITAVKGALGGGGDGNGTMMAFMKMMETSSQQALQASRDQMTMMMNMMTNQTNMTLGMMQTLAGANNNKAGNDPLEMMKMLSGFTREVMNIKSDSEPQEPDRLKDILDFAKEVFPAAFAMLSRVPKPARKAVVAKFTGDSKEFKDLKENPEMLAEALNVWDKNYGPDKMDGLLADAGLKRPESTFKNYDLYKAEAAGAEGGNEASNNEGTGHAEET